MTGKDATTLLREMIRIRTAEETVAELYKEQEMRTPTHFSIGQEAVAVGVCQALERTDVAYSGHRCHAEYLAKGGSLLGMIAELYGRVDGCCKGRGGSVHLNAPEVGHVASSAILGETMATAVGSAWAFAMDGLPRVAVTFFGDGVCEEGIFHETMNFAVVRKLPVIFACGNNGYSTHTKLSVRQPENVTIWQRAQSYGMPSVLVDGNDVFAVYEATKKAVEWCRAGNGPYFVEATTYRWREHVGPHWDWSYGYRTQEEVESWVAKDPIARAAKTLVAAGVCTEADVEGWKHQAQREVDEAVAEAKASPFPDPSDLMVGTY